MYLQGTIDSDHTQRQHLVCGRQYVACCITCKNGEEHTKEEWFCLSVYNEAAGAHVVVTGRDGILWERRLPPKTTDDPHFRLAHGATCENFGMPNPYDKSS